MSASLVLCRDSKEAVAAAIAAPPHRIPLGNGRVLLLQEWHPHIIVDDVVKMTIKGAIAFEDGVVS